MKANLCFGKYTVRFTHTLSLLVLLFLISCTGTSAPSQPLFVIAGIQDDANGTNPRVLLLQDRILEPNLPTDAPRFVSFTSQSLGATARAFDVVDEAGTREELVVLSRSQTGDTVSAFLDFFNTRGLLVSDPATFRISRNPVDLSTLTFPTALCPIDLEVTRDGIYGLIYNSPIVCNPATSSGNDSIVVILLPPRLPGTTPASITSTILSSTFIPRPLLKTGVFAGEVSRGGYFLDQSGDTLYYLRQNIDRLELRRLERSSYASTTFDETDTTTVQVISSDISIGADEFRDITKVSGNLAVLGAGSYVLAPPNTTTTAPPEVDSADARFQDPRAFIPDATGNRLFILDDNDKIVYHPDPTLPANTETDVRGTIATINTNSDFLYIAGRTTDNRNLMSIVDLLPLINEGNTNLNSLLVEETCNNTVGDGLCGLNNPTALTWAEGILLPEEQ